jgi:hypothetical protein
MKATLTALCGLFLLSLTFTSLALAQQCTDCNQTTGECLPPENYCDCSCFSRVVNGVRHCTATGACGGHEICPVAYPPNPQTLVNYPWLANTGLAKELASHSVMPNAAEILDEVRTVQLKEGSVSIRRGYVQDTGYRFQGKSPVPAENRTKGTQWWQLASDDGQKMQVLTMWDDPELKWNTTADIHHSKVRLPITETITFYSDHWEQVNANGKSSHELAAYTPPGVKQNSATFSLAEGVLTGR